MEPPRLTARELAAREDEGHDAGVTPESIAREMALLDPDVGEDVAWDEWMRAQSTLVPKVRRDALWERYLKAKQEGVVA